jgi:hypothetical protein
VLQEILMRLMASWWRVVIWRLKSAMPLFLRCKNA